MDAYQIFALVGGSVFAVMFVLQLIGLGEHDVDHGHAGDADSDSTGFFSILSIRSVTAALMFFGLSGMAAQGAQLPWPSVLTIAIVSGGLALYLVAMLMRSLAKLAHSGSLDIHAALGQPGTVYLKVPASNGGQGKVTVTVQGRSETLLATTPGEELPTGTAIFVQRVTSADTVEVVKAPEVEG